MSLIIHADEVVDAAFAENDQIDRRAISDYRIESAQLKFLRPVLGDMYRAVENGVYPDFTSKFIKPALAWYVKYAVLPELAVKTGNTGIMRSKSANSDSAEINELTVLRKEAKKIAGSLLDKAVDHLCENREQFPEYNPEKNVRKRISVNGGIIL